MYGGEGMDDPNWDDEFASSIGGRLASFADFVGEHYGKGTSEERYVDRWLYSVVNRIIVEVTDAMEQTLYRTALQKGFFDMQRHLRWYMRRCGTPNENLLAWFCEVQTRFLTPFTPHLAEEMWEIAGRHGFASLAEFPQPDGGRIDESVEAAEEYVKHAIEDITEIMRVARIESPERVYIYIAEPWKWQAAQVCSSHKNQSDAMKALMADPEMKKRGKEVSDLVTKLFKERPTLHHIDEKAVLMEAHEFIAREVGVPLEIGSEYDPERKARFAMPMRPAIYIKQ
jgi:leucyl-tRNA synthetase